MICIEWIGMVRPAGWSGCGSYPTVLSSRSGVIIARQKGVTFENKLAVTSSNVGDAPMLPELLDQIPPVQDIGSVTADGAYDTRKCHEAIAARDASAIIPPRKNAKPLNLNSAVGARKYSFKLLMLIQ